MRKSRFLACSLVLGVLVFCASDSSATSDDLLVNSGFQSDLSGWVYDPSATQWSSLDVNGSVSSGSARISNNFSDGGVQVIRQCVLLSPSAGPFDAGARFFLPSGQGQRAYGAVFVGWYSSSDCTGGFLSRDQFNTPAPPQTDSWTLAAGYRITPPVGSVSADVSFGIGKFDSPTGPTVDGYVDQTFFRLTSCTSADADLCLNGGRFRVTAQWESPYDGGIGHGVQFNDESGYFWFFSADNTEVVVKVHGACVDPFNRYWVFAAGLTNVLVTLNVEDTAAGVANHYINPQGTAFVALQDTQAFATCP